MIDPKRRKGLLALLDRHTSATVEQLSAWLNVSIATVRRDICFLAERKMLVRVRGGAERMPPLNQHFPLLGETFASNLTRHGAQKRAIARYAASLCTDGDTIIVNGGTTTYMMTEFLAEKRLKILTNSFLMAERLLTTSRSDIILSGGQVYREQNVILTPFDADITRHHYASRMFMGIYGISSLGLMEADPMLIEAERRLINQAEELIVLADSSKFSNRSGLILCGLDKVSCIVTDSNISADFVRMVKSAGVRLEIVDPERCPAPAILVR